MRRIVIALILLGVACESGTAPLAPNDTVSETIDTPADVDDFRFIGTAGQIVNLFLQQLGTSNRNLRADLYDDEAPLPPSQPPLPPFPVAVDFGVVPNADLEAAASGLYTLTASGHYRIRVYTNGFAGADTAAVPYHMQLYVVDTLPEHANPRITLGDTISEAIDHVGDIDTYTLSATPGTQLNIFLARSLPIPNVIYTVVREPGRTVPLAQFIANAGSNLLDSASATFVVPASGTVAIQLEGTSRGALFRGGYQLLVSP